MPHNKRQMTSKDWSLGTPPRQEYIGVKSLVNNEVLMTASGLKVTVRFLDKSTMDINTAEDVVSAIDKACLENRPVLTNMLKKTSALGQPFSMSIQDDFIAQQHVYNERIGFRGCFFRPTVVSDPHFSQKIESVIIEAAGLAAGLYFGIAPLAVVCGIFLAYDGASLLASRCQLASNVESAIHQTAGLAVGLYYGIVPLAVICGILLVFNLAHQIALGCQLSTVDTEPQAVMS